MKSLRSGLENNNMNWMTEGKIRYRSSSPYKRPRRPWGEKKMYSSTPSLTSVLVEVGGQRHAPAALIPGKTGYQLYRRLGRPRGRSGRVRKISTPKEIRSPDRPSGRYTDWANAAHVDGSSTVLTQSAYIHIPALSNALHTKLSLLCPRHGDILGSRGKAPVILDPCTRGRWAVYTTPQPL